MVPHHKVGYVVDTNPQAITDALNDFYDHKKESAFRENLKEGKKKYLWNKLTAKVLKLVNEL